MAAKNTGKKKTDRKKTDRKKTDRKKASSFSFVVEPVTTLDIQLDPKNPRLTAEEEGSGQDELLRIMIERFKVEELAESVIAAGYLPFDPLVGWRHDGEVTILEGNRRIAALKLLLDPELAPEKHQKRWKSLSEELPPSTRTEISELNLSLYADRDDADVASYIGFRHVTGVLKWPALEKASYIAHLIERKWTYDKIAETLGSYPKHIERHYIAYRIVEQAKKEGIRGAKNMAGAFGVLLRALQAGGIAEFLGVTYPGNPKKSVMPVPAAKVSDLKDFVVWVFGTDEKTRILPDSRDLTKFGRILRSPSAVAYLRRTARPDFDRAWFKSGGQAESLSEALFTAADRLEESVPLVSEHTDNEDVEAAVRECARYLVQILRYFPAIQKEYGMQVEDA